jgi:hypothetical protein
VGRAGSGGDEDSDREGRLDRVGVSVGGEEMGFGVLGGKDGKKSGF